MGGRYEPPSGLIGRIMGGSRHEMITAPTSKDLWVIISEDEWS